MIYKIATVAVNAEGESPQSDYILLGATDLPTAPVQLSKSEQSDATSIVVEWTESVQTDLPITGYLLQVADFGSVNFTTIFNGEN